jgi:uncharacterized membrane protein
MTALLAVASALVIGTSDFTGGLATRRDTALRVTTVAQLTGAATAVVLALVVTAGEVTSRDVVGGAVAGLSGTFSFACFYRALSIGVMGVVAPVAALVGAVVPAIVGLARGEDVTGHGLVGLAVAVVAIVLVTREGGPSPVAATPRAALALAATAGLGFSAFFLALAETSDEAGMWPLVVARCVSLPVVAIAAVLVTGRMAPRDHRASGLAALTGVTEMVANALIVVALRRGPVAVASVFGSLYPVSTAVLAWAVLRERIGRLQVVGVAMAVVALALVAA